MNKSFVEVLKNTNFRNLWLGQITSQIALNMLMFVLATSVYEKTQSNSAVSFMLLSFNIPAVIFGFLAGGIVDHFDKKDVLMFCNVSRFAILIFFFIFSKSLVALFALSILISIITQLFIPAEAPSIPNLVDSFNLLAANSLFTISFYLSTVLGFILAGPAVALFGYSYIYLFMALMMFIASIYVRRLPQIKPRKGNDNFIINFSFIGKTIDEGIKFIQDNERIKQSLILMTFVQSLLATLVVLAPGFADKILAINLTSASYLVMGPAALGLVVGSFLVGSYGGRFLKGTIILIGILITGIILMLLSLISRGSAPSIILYNNLFLAMILLFGLGIFNSFISVPANTILQGDTDREMRGRVYGVLTSLTGGVSFLPVIFSGIIADVFGVSISLAFLGMIVIIIGVYHYFRRRIPGNIN